MKDSERTVVVVSRASMLRICTATECTTIVFGQGTCVEHDDRDSPGTVHPPVSASTPAEQAHEAVETLSSVP